jgi:spore germination protein GerM
MATKRNGSRTTTRNTRRSPSRSSGRNGRSGRTGTARKRTAGAATRTRARAGGGKRRTPVSVGSLFWTALMLLVLVVFLFNRIAIRDVVERTELVDVLQRSMDDAIGREQPLPLPPVQTAPRAQTAPQEVPATATEPAVQPDPTPSAAAPREATPTPVEAAREPAPDTAAPPRQPAATVRQPAPAATPEPRATEPRTPTPPPDRHHRVFFAAVDASGGISLTGVTRVAKASGAPLRETLDTLLAGPDSVESNRGLITLIPPAVTLNKVYIREHVAYIDVSESFRFNRLGREGLNIQLQQVVYSATQFPNVERVQILIDGQRIDYLASEGTYVGRPIGREAFQ